MNLQKSETEHLAYEITEQRDIRLEACTHNEEITWPMNETTEQRDIRLEAMCTQ